MTARVLVVGDAVLDVHVTPARPIRPGADVPASIRLEPGGQGANLAVRFARRGVDVRLRCALGDDAVADLLRSALVADGVALDAVSVPSTGSVVVLVDPDGRRTMLSHRVPLLGSPVATADAAWLVVSGYVLLEADATRLADGRLPDRRAVVGCALEKAQVAQWRAALRTIGPHLLVLNADEASALTAGATDPAASMADELGAAVVVTVPSGASVAMGGETMTVAREPVAAVDTTGAGDAFAAALIAELLDGGWPPERDDLERAVTTASADAAAVTLVPGAQARVAGER